MKIEPVPGPHPKGSNVVIYGENQPEYLALPALRHNDESGRVTSCWLLSWRDRLRVMWTGRVYLDLLTFKHPIQPQLMYTQRWWLKEPK